MLDGVPDILSGFAKLERVRVAIHHESRNIDLFKGIANSIGRNEKIMSVFYAVHIAEIGKGTSGVLHLRWRGKDE